jgi:hypothetical protein
MNRTCVEAHFIGSGPEDLLNVVKGAKSATYGQGEKEFIGSPLDKIDDDAAFLFGCGDIEKDNFVCTLLIVTPGKLDRVTCIPETEKIGSFHHPSVFEIKTGDDPSREHHWIRFWLARGMYVFVRDIVVNQVL